jgi:hypothetical protein
MVSFSSIVWTFCQQNQADVNSVASTDFSAVIKDSVGVLSLMFLTIVMYYSCFIGKGKAVLLQAWSGPEGSRKLRFPDFMTTAQEDGKFSLTHRPPLRPGNPPGTHFC